MGAWTLYGLGTENQDLPGFLAMNPLSNLGQHNHGSAFLPASMQATMIRSANGDSMPNLEPPHQSSAQQQRQLELLASFNQGRMAQDVANNELEGLISSYELAFRMQSSIPGLMDLTKETPAMLKSYGIGGKTTDAFGRQCLLARRFAEVGVRFIVHDLLATVLHLLGLDHEKLTYRYSGRDFRLERVMHFSLKKSCTL